MMKEQIQGPDSHRTWTRSPGPEKSPAVCAQLLLFKKKRSNNHQRSGFGGGACSDATPPREGSRRPSFKESHQKDPISASQGRFQDENRQKTAKKIAARSVLNMRRNFLFLHET